MYLYEESMHKNKYINALLKKISENKICFSCLFKTLFNEIISNILIYIILIFFSTCGTKFEIYFEVRDMLCIYTNKHKK